VGPAFLGFISSWCLSFTAYVPGSLHRCRHRSTSEHIFSQFFDRIYDPATPEALSWRSFSSRVVDKTVDVAFGVDFLFFSRGSLSLILFSAFVSTNLFR
jgi:hypothetical protein